LKIHSCEYAMTATVRPFRFYSSLYRLERTENSAKPPTQSKRRGLPDQQQSKRHSTYCNDLLSRSGSQA
jgi:hypothetical protein